MQRLIPLHNTSTCAAPPRRRPYTSILILLNLLDEINDPSPARHHQTQSTRGTTARPCQHRRHAEIRRSNAGACLVRFALSKYAIRSGARPRLRPDTEIDGGEVS
jgi:hypothetical protein